MFRIKTMNKISKNGLAVLDKDLYEIGDALDNEDGVLVRSAAMHEYEFPANLKAIARAGAGTNNIPLDRCAEAGIVVFNTPGANANAVKELAICALLMSSRKIPAGIGWCKAQAAEGAEVEKVVEKGKSQFVGPEIMGKTLSVIGLGAIGALVANAALDLGMTVIGYDPFLSPKAALALDPRVKVFDSIDPLFKQGDYFTIHVPFNPDTKDTINADTIAMMKDGARIINLARGGLVNDDAVLAGIESGKVACYVTDFPNNKLVANENVVCIPHLGASSPESEENCAVMASQEIDGYLRFGNIKNSVNLPNLVKDWAGSARICVIRKNDAALVGKINDVVAKAGIAVAGSADATRKDYGYTVLDVNGAVSDAIAAELQALEGVIRVRVLG
ncbi:MAG: 3-phosphoglycerate dehydrogenase [Oscillospiraceae bacterium]|nr:3-phosphoglycerate dehydrogenase [Oscillospiraceae bacterium]